MQGVGLWVSARFEGAAGEASHYVHRSSDLKTALLGAMCDVDRLVLMCVDRGKLLCDQVEVHFTFNPSVPRANLIRVWQDAVAELVDVIDIKPETSGSPRGDVQVCDGRAPRTPDPLGLE
jgi:hypothetical protein